MQELQIGRVYRTLRRLLPGEGLAHDSESGVPCVIYRKLYGDGGLWVRPLEMFLSRVDREKYPEVRQEYRFQLQEIASVAHHKALKYAVKMDLIPFNPADKVERPKKQRYIADYYRQEELERLLEASKDHPYSLLIQMTAFYGLRRSEALGLKWDAIDFERDTITIKHIVTNAKIDGKSEIVLRRPHQDEIQPALPAAGQQYPGKAAGAEGAAKGKSAGMRKLLQQKV